MEIAKIQNNIVQPPHENQKNREGEGGAKKTGADFIDSTDPYPLQDREKVCTIRVIRA